MSITTENLDEAERAGNRIACGDDYSLPRCLGNVLDLEVSKAFRCSLRSLDSPLTGDLNKRKGEQAWCAQLSIDGCEDVLTHQLKKNLKNISGTQRDARENYVYRP